MQESEASPVREHVFSYLVLRELNVHVFNSVVVFFLLGDTLESFFAVSVPLELHETVSNFSKPLWLGRFVSFSLNSTLINGGSSIA